MIPRRNTMAMRESQDNIDHKKMVITRISFADKVKYFFLIACIKEDHVKTFLIIGPILDHIFSPKQDKLFLPCICFPQRYVQPHLWSCAIDTEWRLKHFMNISWCNSIPVLKDGICNKVFYSVTYRKPVHFSKVRWIDMRSRR